MNLIVRVVLTMAVVFVADLFMQEFGRYGFASKALISLGAFSIILGPHVTEGGYWAHYRRVDAGTPGCVWIALGVICWVVAGTLILIGKQPN